jgi:hypothetical protein
MELIVYHLSDITIALLIKIVIFQNNYIYQQQLQRHRVSKISTRQKISATKISTRQKYQQQKYQLHKNGSYSNIKCQ